MIRSTSSEPNKSVRRKRIIVVALLAFFILVLVLAVASYTSTRVMWDGMFPSGEYHLFIRDQAGRPVEGAVLNIYQGKSTNYAFEYPFDNYLSANSLASDADGKVVVIHLPRGLEFGGSGWYLFWFIPIGIGGPEFTCQITADGYKTSKFSTRQIFDTAYDAYNQSNAPTKTVVISGNEFEIMVLEQSIILEEE